MKMRPSLWIFRPFGQPSYCVDQVPFALRADAKIGRRDVHAPQVALAVERRALEKAVQPGKLAVWDRPRGAPLPAHFGRQRGETRASIFFMAWKGF
jgi:hypothetical protein